MGEIVNLENYRRLRRDRTSGAKKTGRQAPPDAGKAEGPVAATTIWRSQTRHSSPERAIKSRGEDSKSD